MTEYYNPVKIIAGEGCVKNFSGISSFGKRAFLVCGSSSAKKCGALDDVTELLRRENVDFSLYDRVTPNPLVSACREGGEEARAFGADFVIGIGGGSPLDAAKAIAAFAANPGLTEEELFTVKLGARKPALPILLVNTTAGTGSEVTQYSVLTVPAVENKKTFSDADTFARAAFLDPLYTESLDARFTVSTAVDALSHVVEGSLLTKANAFTDALADRACALIAKGLRSIAAGKLDKDARADLLYASTMAGLVISRTGTSFVHAMGYPLTYFGGLPHGEANAIFLADFVAFMEKGGSGRVARLLSAMGVASPREMEALYAPLMTLSYRASDAELQKYASVAATARSIPFGVVVATADDLFAIYQSNRFRAK